MNSTLTNNIAYELYKLCAVEMPEKATWSIDELYKHVSNPSSEEKSFTLEGLRNELKSLEEKGAVILVDGYNSINLVEPKLSELFDSRIS